MDHETQIELLDELLGLRKEKSAFLDEAVTYSEVSRYCDEGRFKQEQDQIFSKYPLLLAHASELPEEGSFLRRNCGGIPVLLTRGRDGYVNAFYNVCRHRGARLVEADEGCRHRFTCPYHAWTWDNEGRLIAAPHKELGFPELNFDDYGLKRIACVEVHGWIWCSIKPGSTADEIIDHLGPLEADLDWLEMENYEVHAVEEKIWNCNWKILVEGGLEAYHFRVAHAKTIGALFHDNLSSYQVFGVHMRSILARTSIDDLIELPRKEWDIRQHTNLLYNVFPNSVWLVQSDHFVLLQIEPETVSSSRLRCVTFRPKLDNPLDEKQKDYWDKNHDLTVRTLTEDFELGEIIHSGFAVGVNEKLTFGRFEGALDKFNGVVEAALTD